MKIKERLYPLEVLLDRRSLYVLTKLSGKGIKEDAKKPAFISSSSMTTYEFKMLMEKRPKGRLHAK